MQISLLLMEEIAKLFAIMIMGYVVVKAGLMKASESKSVSVILVYLVIPCVIINAFQVEYTPEIQKGLLLACAAAVAVHILFLGVTAMLKGVLKLDIIERATVIYPNAGILVIPLVQKLLGQEYVIYSSAFIAIQLILLWTHCKNMLCAEQSIDWKKIVLNVNIISIAVGIIFFSLRLEFPSGVQDVLGSVSNMIGPVGMMIAGMVIADKSLLSVFSRKRSYLSATLRLLIYPVLDCRMETESMRNFPDTPVWNAKNNRKISPPAILSFFYHPFTPPSATPATIYLESTRYTTTNGIMVTNSPT